MLPAPKLGIDSESRIPQISTDNLDDAGDADYDAGMRRPDPEFVKDPPETREVRWSAFALAEAGSK